MKPNTRLTRQKKFLPDLLRHVPGLTVLVASGDNGNSAVGSDCTFVPDVVGASPWVTSVGATMPSLDAKPYCAAEGFREEFGQCEELGQALTRACDG